MNYDDDDFDNNMDDDFQQLGSDDGEDGFDVNDYEEQTSAQSHAEVDSGTIRRIICNHNFSCI